MNKFKINDLFEQVYKYNQFQKIKFKNHVVMFFEFN